MLKGNDTFLVHPLDGPIFGNIDKISGGFDVNLKLLKKNCKFL